MAVHVAARILALAAAGEVLASQTTHDLIASADLAFEDRGAHDMKGLSGARSIFALISEQDR